MNPANSNTQSWYIVRIQTGFECASGEDLLGMGFTVYVPQYRKEYRNHRTKGWSTKYFPLLRGYIFVLASQHWARIVSCKNVISVLCSKDFGGDGAPVPIPDDEVGRMRAAQDAGDFDQLRVHGSDVKAGDRVRISEGAFAGIKATVEQAGDHNLTVLLSLLGREVKAAVPLEILQKTG